jgi:SSS family solute:Na+ symporter
MNYLSIDYLIVYAFLFITLVIGLRAGRGIKDIREYAIANKTFGTGALVLTYLATNITGAGVLHVTDIIFSKGIILVLAGGLGVVIDYLLTAWLIAPKIGHFAHCLTMGDLMKALYGPRSGVIAGILGFLTAISIAGMDLLGMSIVCESLLGIKASWCIVVGVFLLAIYSAYGGIKSVTATDVFQFLILMVVFPTMACIFLNKTGGIQAIFSQVPADKLKVFLHENFSLYLTLFLLWSIFPAGMIDPAIMQRFLMAKNGKQVRNQYLIVAGFESAFRLVILFTAFSALVLYPQLENKSVLPHLIQTLLPVGLKGLAIVGLLATSMSSIDSYLHVAGLTLSHDVIKPLLGNRYAINEVRFARYMTVLVSLVAVAIALNTRDTFGLLLDSLAFTGPLLMFPLLSGIMGLKTDVRSFYIAMVATLVTFFGLKLLSSMPGHLLTLCGILANGVVFFGMHIMQNKGIATTNSSDLITNS